MNKFLLCKEILMWVNEYNNKFIHTSHKSSYRKYNLPKFNEDIVVVSIKHINTTSNIFPYTEKTKLS